MAIVFPASPSTNDTFTAGSITYKWDGAKWIGLGVTPTDRLIEGSNSLEINASNELVWTGGTAKFGGSLEVGANIDLTDSTVDLYSQTTNSASKTFQLFSDIGGTKTEKVSITANGSPTFSGVCKVDRTVSGDGCFHAALNGTVNASITSAGDATFAGNVGINRTNPDQKLNVNGCAEFNAYDSANGAGGYLTSSGLIIGNLYDAGKSYTGSDDRTACIWQERGLDLDFATNNLLRMKITYDGKVGINESNPDRQLSVYDASNSGVEIKSNTDGQSSVFFTDTADGNIGMIGYTHNNDEMFFRVNDQTRVSITSDGYVTKPNTPYFSVQGSPSLTNFTNHVNSVYNFATINSNNGSHYNNSTGRFTAPVAGFYWFSGGVWSSNGDDSGGTYLLNLLRENIGGGTATELQFAGANHRTEKNQLAVSAGVYMSVGQTVRLWYNGSIQGSTPRNYFSGYLVG